MIKVTFYKDIFKFDILAVEPKFSFLIVNVLNKIVLREKSSKSYRYKHTN